MSARCGICLKFTSNNKQRLRLVTSDAEAKIQYGYYSLHNKDLNRILLNTKVHEKCYKKYQDRWYNQSIRNNKLSNVSTAVQDEVMLVDDENDVPEENSSLSVLNIDDCNENDYGYHDEQDDRFSICKSLFSTRNISNESTFQKNQSALSNISNIDYSSCSEIISNIPDQNFDTEDLPFNSINRKNSIDDNEVMSLESLLINSSVHIIQNADKHEATVTSDIVDEESSSSTDYHGLTSTIEPANEIRIPLHSKHQTSTPKVITTKNVLRTKQRRRSEEGAPCTTGDHNRSLIYDSPIDELRAWLNSVLRDGRLIPLTDVQSFYSQIIKNYKHHHQQTDSTVRCDILRKQLEVKYPNQYHFETVNKRDGTYIALNDISHYSRAAIHMSKSSTFDHEDRQDSSYEALHDHAMSFYHDYEPFIDHSLTPHLFAYGFIKSYFNRLKKCNLPLYSGFMAMHLPHNNRSRHKVTFMTPINEDPNKIGTSKECISQMKKLLLDSGLQNDAVLIVDERIFRLCTEVKDEDSTNFEGIFLYPGDFHMMKCAMIVIWGVLEESGIDNLMGLLYKDATHRAVLSVAHFNKSLRAIKLLYTALLILIHNEFIATLSLPMVDEIEELMNQMPLDASDVEESKTWYASILDYLSNVKIQDAFDSWIKNNCEKNLKFRFWTFVLFDLITPLIKLYTALRTSNFSARNAAVCELAELFFATNHRQYARLTARHISDLRVCPQHLLDRLSNSFAVVRTNRNFSSIALDQTIEVTINKMGKGHGGITGRCSMESIDIWSKSYTFRSLLSTVASELAGIESNINSMESHVECSQTRMESDHVDLQIILDRLIDEKLFSLDTNDVTQIFTGKVIHSDIIESNCVSRIIGAEKLKEFIHERLVNCSTPLSATLNASSLLHIRDNDTYESSQSNVKSPRRKSMIDLTKIDAEIRRILLLSQYRPIDLESVFSHELSTIPISLCSLEDVNLLNQQSKSKDTFEFLKQKFPTAIYSTNIPTTNQPKALVIDGSSLLHIYPRTGSNAFQHALYLLIEHILPYFADYSRIDIIFDSPKSRDLKAFTNRYTNRSNVQSKYNHIMRNSILPTGKAFQNFVTSNRAIFAASVIESWKETEATNLISSGCVLIVAGPDEKAFKLEKDKQPEDLIELESNQIEADSRIILHIDHILHNYIFNVVVKSIDTDVIILCIYHASLFGLHSLLVDATVPKKQFKVIDCKFIHDELIDRYGVNPLIFLIVYALSGCDTCSFTRNVSKRTFMQVLFDTPNDFNDLQKLTTIQISKDDIIAVERLFVRCFSSNRRRRQSTSIASGSNNLSQMNVKDVSINQLRAIIAMVSLKKNTTNIAISLPPTKDSLFYHCLRTSRQVEIWIQAPDSYIKYPDLQESGFKIIDGRVEIQWTSKLPFPNDRLLTCYGKHKGKCTRCVCILNQLPCTIFCQCDFDCPNRILNQTVTTTSQTLIRSTKEKKDSFTLNSRLTTAAFDYEYYSGEEVSDQSSDSTDYCSTDDVDEVSDRTSSSSEHEQSIDFSYF
ncbi:unnamed protein product [Rotaria sp. Silwood1]|nr:unnamed protein product [Rotaria sp. Silwood1]CAF4946108.1 unnamed protein product [Rotaria sp. Silwood1]